MYKPLKLLTQKTLRLIAPPNISPPPRGRGGGACTWKLPSIQSEAKKNGKFPSKNKVSPIHFETQNFPPYISHSEYKPWGLFSDFYGISLNVRVLTIHTNTLCINIKLLNLTWWDNDPLQRISK